MVLQTNFSLLKFNTFGIDARCAKFYEFVNEDELCTVLSMLKGETPLILGAGSNLLLTGDYSGSVVHSRIMGYEVVEDNPDYVLLRVGSGETWDDIVELAVKNGWYGTENLSLIPGEVGASAIQNIGAYGSEVKDVIYAVEAIDITTGNMVVKRNSECNYSYRQSRFKKDWKDRYIITNVIYKLSKSFIPIIDYGNIKAELDRKGVTNLTAMEVRRAVIEIRRAKLPDPKVQGNAGSFFMNPIIEREKFMEMTVKYKDMPHYEIDEQYVKIPAGWMIEQCGWKGKSLGRAGVHKKQALVLVNRGGASGLDLLHLSDSIRRDVKDKFGIDIFPEVNII
jgi:UDP-N-acetylmuramate dehydrogenase